MDGEARAGSPNAIAGCSHAAAAASDLQVDLYTTWGKVMVRLKFGFANTHVYGLDSKPCLEPNGICV